MLGEGIKMDYGRIAQIGFGVAIFCFAMSAISPFVCGRRNPHSCSHDNSNYSTESNYISNYKEKRSLLRKLADTDKNKVLDNRERAKMYEMCNVADEKSGYVLNIKDLEKGIENYLEN